MTVEIQRILDLGIGEGGPYIAQDPEGVERVGFDGRSFCLEKVQREYGIQTILGDAQWQSKEIFPLPQGHFQEVQAYFPTDGLLEALTQPKSHLWQEIQRVLSPNGRIKIVTDCSRSGKHLVYVNDESLYLRNPQVAIDHSMRTAGFATDVEYLDRPVLEGIGTRTALYLAPAISAGIVQAFQVTGTR